MFQCHVSHGHCIAFVKTAMWRSWRKRILGENVGNCRSIRCGESARSKGHGNFLRYCIAHTRWWGSHRIRQMYYEYFLRLLDALVRVIEPALMNTSFRKAIDWKKHAFRKWLEKRFHLMDIHFFEFTPYPIRKIRNSQLINFRYSALSAVVPHVSTWLLSLSLWSPRFCFSSGNTWWSLGDEFPWYGYNHCNQVCATTIVALSSAYQKASA
jgi:hypothetical protein